MSRGLRVLVVDDHPDTAHAMAVCIRLLGHDSRSVLDARGALDCAATYQPDAGFIDLRLPGDDGLHLARDLRARFPSIYLVLMTGFSRPDLPRRAREAGYDRYVIKPLELSSIRSALRDATRSIGRASVPAIA